MTIIKRVVPRTKPLTEAKAISCIASHFEWFRNMCFPNVYFAGGEMDLCILTAANYVWEVEVKLSLSDWKADAKKDKWCDKDRQYISRFYYAVPTHLIDKIPEFVPDEAGIIEVYYKEFWGYRVKIIRPSTHKRGLKITERQRANMFLKVYWKYWQKRIRNE